MGGLGITAREDILKVHPQLTRIYSKYFKLKIMGSFKLIEDLMYFCKAGYAHIIMPYIEIYNYPALRK